jgi:hypothetical protein
VLNVSFNITGRVQQHQIVDIKRLLSAKTIWGGVSWLDIARGHAIDQLQQDYTTVKAAEELMRNTCKKLRPIQVLSIKVAPSTITDQI